MYPSARLVRPRLGWVGRVGAPVALGCVGSPVPCRWMDDDDGPHTYAHVTIVQSQDDVAQIEKCKHNSFFVERLQCCYRMTRTNQEV